MSDMLIAIRLRGTAKVRADIADTLSMLRLRRPMHAVLLPETPEMLGMLRKVRNWITWGRPSDELLARLIAARGRKPGCGKLTTLEVSQIIANIKAGKRPAGLKPVFRLTPPSGGFRQSIKQHWPRGELGDRGDKINELLKRMI